MNVTDLFMAGLGCDIAGAFFLSRGLIASSADMARRRRMYSDFSAPLTVGQARDRVDGEVGMVALVLGFVLQAVAYEVGFFSASPATGTWRAAAIGGALTAAAICAVILARRLLEPRVLRHLVRVAHHATGYGTGTELERPSAVQLSHYGREYGIPMLDSERATLAVLDEDENGHVQYARRVFGVEATLAGGAALFHGEDA